MNELKKNNLMLLKHISFDFIENIKNPTNFGE